MKKIISTALFLILFSVLFLFLFIRTNRKNSVLAINARDYGTVGDCVTDDTAAMQSAIAALTSGYNTLELPAGCYKISDTLVFDSMAGIRVVGEGMTQNGTIIKFADSTKNIIHVSGRQFFEIENIAFTYSVKPSSGYAIVIEDSFESKIVNVRMWNVFNGIKVIDSTETHVQDIDMRYILGSNGVFFGSDGGVGSYGMTINNVVADNPYPAVFTNKKNWTANTSYSVGDVVFVNNAIYQVSQAGVSGSSSPNGVPGTNAVDAFSTTIQDGTVLWKFVAGNLTWITMDSKAHSLRGDSIALLNGKTGFASTDTLGSYPTLLDISKLECDHNLMNAINLSAGANFNFVGGFAGSSLSANGVVVGSSFIGGLRISGMDIRGNYQYGVLVNGGRANILSGNMIGDNGQGATGVYHGVVVASNVSELIITDNFIGDAVDSGANKQGYGIYILGGTGDYIKIQSNILKGNLTGKVFNGSSGPNNEIQTL